jgi:adenosine/AMP kinase
LTSFPGKDVVKTEEVVLKTPEGSQLIIGQAHFIKTVEDIYEAIATSMPAARFGVAFCEASGKALVRSDGTDPKATQLATEFAERIGAGHCFVVVLDGSFPINVLPRIRTVEEVVGIFCATANEVTVIVADTGQGRGILGVVDGVRPKGLESEQDKAERHAFLRKIGYKR